MPANDSQVAGSHYKSPIQHWDYVVANDLDYFQAQITKYVTRWKKKNGLQDLQKAKHFLEKYLELAPGLIAKGEDANSSDPTKWAKRESAKKPDSFTVTCHRVAEHLGNAFICEALTRSNHSHIPLLELPESHRFSFLGALHRMLKQEEAEVLASEVQHLLDELIGEEQPTAAQLHTK